MAAVAMAAMIASMSVRADATNATAGGADRKPGATLVEASEAAKLITEKKVVVLDVRMPAEFANGHIAGAMNLDIYDKDFRTKLEKLDKNQAYLVHCAVGMRSAKACKIMDQEGFNTLYDLKGGFDAWKKARLPVEK
jgi:rhodanese-related sulfurtransferase